MEATDIISLVLPEVRLTAAQRRKLNQFLIVSGGGSPRRTGRQRETKGPRHSWTDKERAVLRGKARAGLSPAQIADFFADPTITPTGVRSQLYLIFPPKERRGINFDV